MTKKKELVLKLFFAETSANNRETEAQVTLTCAVGLFNKIKCQTNDSLVNVSFVTWYWSIFPI